MSRFISWLTTVAAGDVKRGSRMAISSLRRAGSSGTRTMVARPSAPEIATASRRADMASAPTA